MILIFFFFCHLNCPILVLKSLHEGKRRQHRTISFHSYGFLPMPMLLRTRGPLACAALGIILIIFLPLNMSLHNMTGLFSACIITWDGWIGETILPLFTVCCSILFFFFLFYLFCFFFFWPHMHTYFIRFSKNKKKNF